MRGRHTSSRRPFPGERLLDPAPPAISLVTNWWPLAGAPDNTRRLLRRCLEKDPRKRLRRIADWQELLTETERAAPSRSRLRLVWLACLPAALVAATAVAWIQLHRAPIPEITRFEIHAPPGTTLPLGTPAVSPDGRTIVFAAADKEGVGRLYVRTLDSEEARLLPGTEGAIHPFFSPDGHSVAFAAGTSRLMRIDLAGGVPRPIAEPGTLGPWHGTWNKDGVVLFSGSRQVSANGGPVTDLHLTGVGHPFFLPDGRRWLGLQNTGPKILLFTLGSNQPKLVLDNAESAVMLAPTPAGQAYLLYLQGNDLMAREFNQRSGQVESEPVVIASDIGRVARPDLVPALGVSRSGTIAFQKSGRGIDRLTWLDRSGKQLGESSPGFHLRLSPDGRFAAVTRTTRGTRAIWVVDLERGASTRLSSEGQNDWPIWSHDGKRIAWALQRGESILEKSASGLGAEAVLLKSDIPVRPLDWSPDGKYLVFLKGAGLALLSTAGDGKPIPANGTDGRFSPDGKYLAYTSSESGRSEVYVQPIPPTTERWQVSTEGGTIPAWRRDGKELFYWTPGSLMAVDVKMGNSFTAGQPHRLFPLINTSSQEPSFAVSADGQRFLVSTDQSSQSSGADSPIIVVQNWWVAMDPGRRR